MHRPMLMWKYYKRRCAVLRQKREKPIPSWNSILSPCYLSISAAFSCLIFFFCLLLVYRPLCSGCQAAWTGLCVRKRTRNPLRMTGETSRAVSSHFRFSLPASFFYRLGVWQCNVMRKSVHLDSFKRTTLENIQEQDCCIFLTLGLMLGFPWFCNVFLWEFLSKRKPFLK